VNEESLRAAYALLLDERAGRDDCVAPEALLAVVDGSASEAERLRTLRHVAGCRECRAEFELLRTAGDVAERVEQRSWRRPLLTAAAGIFLMISGAALWQALQPSAETMRGEATTVLLLSPAEDIPTTPPVRLIWAQVPGARQYEVEIVRADGAPVYETVTADTTLDVPETAGLIPGTEYRWWVSALLTDGTQPRSAPRRLRISP
jgi:hypothetical protein